MTVSDVEVREFSEQHTAVVRHTISMDETSKIPEWILQTMEAVQRSGQDIAGPPFFRSFSMGEDSMDIEVGWPVAEPFTGDGEVLASTLPGGMAAVAAYYGPFEGIEPAYVAIQAWCAEHGREIAGPPWESYITDPSEEPDQSKWRTDVHFPLKT